MPGASKGKSGSPRRGSAQIKGTVSRAGSGRTPGGSKVRSSSPNKGSAKRK